MGLSVHATKKHGVSVRETCWDTGIIDAIAFDDASGAEITQFIFLKKS